MAQMPFVHVEIEPAASDFLELLRELGHVDDVVIDQMTSELLQGSDGKTAVSLADARRVAAVHLFNAQAAMRPEARELLTSEWPRLFG